VRQGLREGGFAGSVERFGWSSMLGPLSDHINVGPDHPRTGALAARIAELRRANPSGSIVVMGLSAGTGIAVFALEKLPRDVAVDHVVLLSPSISSHHDLSKALRHIKGRLYATNSGHDAILSAAGSSGLQGGRPAGLVGFRLPSGLSAEGRRLYGKVVNLPWRPEYVAYGWDGRHVSVTRSDFIRVVIAPRIIDELPHPLDRPMARMDN
jgi:pimeloyl-ACP methyl ester carboxylesterase